MAGYTPHAVSKVRESRAARWAAWDAMSREERIAAGIVKVVALDGACRGYARDFGRPYTGEAGFSRRLRVHWQTGTTGLCALKGMLPAYEAPNLPGGFAEWTLR